MKFIVTTGAPGHCVEVEVDDQDQDEAVVEAAREGVMLLQREWPNEYICRQCEAPQFFEVHVFTVGEDDPVVFEIGHDVQRKAPE